MKRAASLLCALLVVHPASVYAAVARGTSAGFVSTAPSTDPAGSTQATDANIRCTKDTAPADATSVTEIGWWCDNATEESNFEVGLYAHDATNDKPDALLAGVSRTNAKGTDAGWKKAQSLTISITGGTVYWICWQLDDTATATNLNYTNTVSQGDRSYTRTSQTTMVDPIGTGAATADRVTAVYAVYATGGAALAIVPPSVFQNANGNGGQ